MRSARLPGGARDFDAYTRRHATRFRDELLEFLRIPSVSAERELRHEVARAAEWCATAMRRAGLVTEVHGGAGHPIVLGEWRGARAGSPTVLVYGHYDVQPPGPPDLWQSPPFAPEIRDGRVFARGATDDKAQLLLHIQALEALFASSGELPVNVVVLAEGEEEIGSPSLAPFIERHSERLRGSAVVISDSAMLAPGQPAVVTTLRGFLGLEIEVFGPQHELHSGEYGGTVVNPALALARILATIHDSEGRIVVPGFADRCREWPVEQRVALEAIPFSEESFRLEAGVPALGGEAGYSTLERRWMRPTFEILGFVGGHTGQGLKSIVPASALAKIGCRLVPDQDPGEIEQLVRTHVERAAPAGVRVEVRALGNARPWSGGANERLLAAAERATRATFGRPPARLGGGGSIPVVSEFERVVGAPALLLGFGLPGENAHAPNECFSLDNFDLGRRTVAELWNVLGEG